ncbi:hypothetical protein BGZ60DRAFT_436739 [Tricladium varicosporioides]|nr:hypothetical protein BGZ60DRAFT_436739 [Hymenoscyphus varicosporioides]
MSVKRIDVNRPWVHLTSEEPLVLCCKGLGQPIVPTTPNQQCRPWKTVPHRQNFLVATAVAVKCFLYQQHQGPDGSRLNPRLEWLYGSTLVQSHKDYHEQKLISHVQLVCSVRDCSLGKELIGKVRSCGSSCFIFSATGPHLICLRALGYQRKPPRKHLTKEPPPPQCSDYQTEKLSLIGTFELDNASGTSPDSETYLGSSLRLTSSTSSYESQDYVTEAQIYRNEDAPHQATKVTTSVLVQHKGDLQLPKSMSLHVVDKKIDIPRYLPESAPKSLRRKKGMTRLRNLDPEVDESETQETYT